MIYFYAKEQLLLAPLKYLTSSFLCTFFYLWMLLKTTSVQGPQTPSEAYRGLRGLMAASTQPLRPTWRPLKCSAVSAAPFPPHDLTL